MRVLIVRCGALGDLVYATSVLDALKINFGNDTIIDFVTTPGTGTLFQKDDRVNKVFPLKHKKIPILFSQQKQKIIKESKLHTYDYLINFESGYQFKSLIKNINAKTKVGFFSGKVVNQENCIHMVDYIKAIFKDIIHKSAFEKSVPKLIGSPINELKKFNLSKKYLVISPSNSHQKRNIINYRAWENDYWIQLINRLSEDIEVVIIGNKNEDEFFDKLKPYPKNVVDLVAKTSLVELIGVINNAVGIVSTDTGTSHIASAVNTEVFALIGPTPAEQTGPYQTPYNKVHIISAQLDCSPCYKTDAMKKCTDNICMKQISPQMVFNKIYSANIL